MSSILVEITISLLSHITFPEQWNMTNGINQNFKAAIHLMVLNHQVLKLHITHSTSIRGGYKQEFSNQAEIKFRQK